MAVANVVMFEFDSPENLTKWANWYREAGAFPNNLISLFVRTGDTSAIGIATYPDEDARAEADNHRKNSAKLENNNYVVREIVPLSGPVLVEFIKGVLSN